MLFAVSPLWGVGELWRTEPHRRLAYPPPAPPKRGVVRWAYGSVRFNIANTLVD